MSRRTGRANRINAHFAWHKVEMLRSPAWAVLSLSARRILDRLEIELSAHAGEENGKLPVTFDDLMRFGIGNRRCIAPAIRELVALGFVEITEQGRAGNREFRRPNLFRLTYRHTGRADPTDEWKRVKTLADAEAIAREARPK